MAENGYGMVRCGEVEHDGKLVAPLGPNGETCRRAPNHPPPHTCATKDNGGTISWTGQKPLDSDEWWRETG